MRASGGSPGTVDLLSAAKQAFLRIKEEFDGAIVFLDEAAAEIVRWSVGGTSYLFDLGASNVLLLLSLIHI